MMDFNGNGKHDLGDGFIGYNIYKDCTDNNTYVPSSSREPGPFASFFRTVMCISLFICCVISPVGLCILLAKYGWDEAMDNCGWQFLSFTVLDILYIVARVRNVKKRNKMQEEKDQSDHPD